MMMQNMFIEPLKHSWVDQKYNSIEKIFLSKWSNVVSFHLDFVN